MAERGITLQQYRAIVETWKRTGSRGKTVAETPEIGVTIVGCVGVVAGLTKSDPAIVKRDRVRVSKWLANGGETGANTRPSARTRSRSRKAAA